MESASNGLVALLLGVYLAGVVRHGNAQALINNAIDDRGFVWWIIAIVIVSEVITRTGDIGRGLAILLALGLTITAGPIVFPQLDRMLTGALQK